MQEITKENIVLEYPNNLRNSNLIIKRNLNDKYFKLLNKYNKFLTSFLKEKLPLKEIDKNMKESELNFVKVKNDDMDFYQKTSTMGFDYIYLRNNIYVEKLNDEDIKFLEEHNEYNEDVSNFIKKTYKNVINPYENSQIMFYGPENSNFMCSSDDIVLGIRYDEFNIDMDGESFKENFLEKQEIVSQLITLLYLVGLKEIDTNVKTIQYNDVSIMQKYEEGLYEK